MSIRTIISTAAAIAALFALPAAALAVPSHDQSLMQPRSVTIVGPPTHFGQDPVRHVTLSQPSTPAATAQKDGGDANTLTIVLLAGGTLVLVALAGYEAGREIRRRRAIRS